MDNITKWSINYFRSHYKDSTISGDQIFNYIYGILHSPTWRERYAKNLVRELPRIPLAKDFGIFAKAGAKLSELHLGYESCSEYPLELVFRGEGEPQKEHFKIGTKKMTFTDKEKSILWINEHFKLERIPIMAHNYVVNGRSPLEWFIDRYKMSIDKKNGICNNPNDWFEDPGDLVKSLRRIVQVSVKTVQIVDDLPDPLD